MLGLKNRRPGEIRAAVEFDRLHPWFTWVRDYLRACAGSRKLPGRADIDPMCFRPNLNLVNLVDVVHEDGRVRFRFRLVGTTQTEMAEREITGRFVEDAVLPAYVARINSNMRAVVENGMPVYDRFPMPHPEREFLDSERVYFPLASDGETVDMILIACAYPSMPEMAPKAAIDPLAGFG
ncbi:MAG: PAS domain-containing protein [Rhodospirillales bacterium]|nr:PAS domain-containing protein [Rhodospirillales bacterium]